MGEGVSIYLSTLNSLNLVISPTFFRNCNKWKI